MRLHLQKDEAAQVTPAVTERDSGAMLDSALQADQFEREVAQQRFDRVAGRMWAALHRSARLAYRLLQVYGVIMFTWLLWLFLPIPGWRSARLADDIVELGGWAVMAAIALFVLILLGSSAFMKIGARIAKRRGLAFNYFDPMHGWDD